MTIKLVALALVVAFFIGIGFFLGWHMKPEPTLGQPEPAPQEAFEVPATIEATAEIVRDTVFVPNTIVKTDTVLVNRNVYLPRSSKPIPDLNISATHPFYFAREGASFQMDITYRYQDQKFRFDNMQFNAPKPKVVYRERILKFGSAIGLLTDSTGEYKLLLQPINFSLWKFNIYPTLMVSPEYEISYGGLVGFRWDI